MKKFAKIMALALALCMVMSVAAFASSAELTSTDRVVNVTVTGAGADEQVALLILKNGATVGASDEAILYVGQMAADENGDAAFGNITIGGTEASVDVYAGSATYAANHDNTYETVITGLALTNGTTDVAVVMGTVTTKNVNDETTDNLGGSAVSAAFTFTLPTKSGVSITDAQMIWSLRAADGTVKYTEPIPIKEKLPTAGLEGTVRLSVAFANGTKIVEEGTDEVHKEIVDASAIFQFTRNDNTKQELIYDEATDGNKKDPSSN